MSGNSGQINIKLPNSAASVDILVDKNEDFEKLRQRLIQVAEILVDRSHKFALTSVDLSNSDVIQVHQNVLSVLQENKGKEIILTRDSSTTRRDSIPSTNCEIGIVRRESEVILRVKSEQVDFLRKENERLRKRVADLESKNEGNLFIRRNSITNRNFDLKEDVESPKVVEEEDLVLIEKLPNSVIEFERDSPFFQRHVSLREQLVDNMEKHLKSISKLALELCNCSNEYSRICKELAKEFCCGWDDVEVDEEKGSALSLDTCFRDLGLLLNEIEEIQSLFTLSFRTSFANPLQLLSETYAKEIRKSSTAVEKSRELYESSLVKFLSSKNSLSSPEKNKNSDLAGDNCEKTLEKFESHMFEHIEKLNEALVLRKVEIVEYVCSCFYALNVYFHSGRDLSISSKNHAKKLQILLEKRRESFNTRVKAKTLRKASVFSKNRTGSFSIIPHCRSNSKPILAKEGYLFKQSSSLKRDWKKRWFILEKSTLSYCRNSKNVSLVSLLNVILCSVRILEDHDRPFCFEIISPVTKRNYILQASTDLELKSWIEAIRSCTEYMLQNSEDSKIGLIRTGSVQKDPGIEFEVTQILQANNYCAECDSKGITLVNNLILIHLQILNGHQSIWELLYV